MSLPGQFMTCRVQSTFCLGWGSCSHTKASVPELAGEPWLCEGAHTQVGGLLPPVEAAGVWAGYPIPDACLQALNQVYPQ